MSIYSVLSELEKRNKLADRVIGQYVGRCKNISVGIGAIGSIAGIFVPAAGWAAAAASLTAKQAAIFNPMVQRIGKIYLAPPELLTDANWDVNLLMGLPFATGAELSGEFGAELLTELTPEILGELGINLAAGWMPIIGGIISGIADYKIAEVVTRHIGNVASAYYQNGGEWIGSKRNTFRIMAGFNDQTGTIRHHVPEINRSLVDKAQQIARVMKDYMEKQLIVEALRKQNFPNDIIDAVTRDL